MRTPLVRNSVLLCMLLLGSVFLGVGETHSAWQLKKIIDSTTLDAFGNPLIGSDGIRALYRYDRTDEPWSNPGKYGFTGWGADGRKYVNGDTSEIQGQISFEGNVLPTQDINGQQWEYGGGLWDVVAATNGLGVEEDLVSTDGDILQFAFVGDNMDINAPEYSINIPELATEDEWVIRTRVRFPQDSKSGVSLGVSNGTSVGVLNITPPNVCFGPCSDSLEIGALGSGKIIPQPTAWHTYELRRENGIITVFVDNMPMDTLAWTVNPLAGDFGTVVFLGRSFAGGGASSLTPEVFAEIDFIRVEVGSPTFTQVPRAVWHSEAPSMFRGPTEDFPEQALIVGDHNGVSILNLRDNEPERWMRFRYFNGNAIGNATGLVTDLHMVNGKLIVPKGPVKEEAVCISFFCPVITNSDGLFVIDFTDGYMYRMDTTDVRRTDAPLNWRNAENLSYDTVVHGTGISNTNVAFVDGVVTETGETMVTLTEYPATASLWNGTTWERVAHYANSGDRNGVYDIALTTDGTWYVSESGTSFSSGALAVFYDVINQTGLLAPDHQYELTGVENSIAYDWLQQVYHLHVREGKSTVPGSNLLLWIGIHEYDNPCGERFCSGYYQWLLTLNEDQGDETQSVAEYKEFLGGFAVEPPMVPLGAIPRVTPRALVMLSDFGVLLSRHILNIGPPALTQLNGFVLEVRNLVENPGDTLMESVPHSMGAITDADFLTQRYPIGGMALGGSPTEVYYGLPNGLYVYEFINNLDVTLSNETLATAAEYELLISPLREIPDGARIDLVFGGGFGGLGDLEPADITASGTNVTGSSSVIDATLRTIGVTLTTSAPVQETIAITIGDGPLGVLNDIINPDIPGIYTVSYAIYNEEGVFIENGVLRLPLGVSMGADPLSFELEVGAEIQEAAIMTFDATTKSITIDPLVNDGLNTSGFSQITVATNAPGGYALYARLDDGNGINQLSNNNGDAIPAGTGENAFGFEAVMGATYDALRAVVADTFFAAVDTLVTAGGDPISRNEATNPETHTIYYQVDVDFAQPAGSYAGTIYYSIVGNF